MANETGKFRRKRSNFAQVSNVALMDFTLSMKAKGLYSMIQSLITIPDFVLYKQTLINACKEGRDSFNAAWNELKNSGYLVQYRIKNLNGTFSYEYELIDDPKKEKESKDNNLTGDGFSVCGLSDSGTSVNGEAVDINNNQENNTEINNINLNNNDNEVVVDNANYDTKVITDRITDMKYLDNCAENEKYKASSDPEIQKLIDEDLTILKYAQDFDELYTKKKPENKFYKSEYIAKTFVVMSSAYRSSLFPGEAKKLLEKVFSSFTKLKDKVAILKLNKNQVNELYQEAIGVVDGTKGATNKEAYLAQIVRTVIANSSEG